MVDSHCHLNFSAFKDDTPQTIARAQAAGVTSVINVGSQFSTSERAVRLTQEHAGLYAAIGLHPVHLFEQEMDEEGTRFKTRAEVFNSERYRQLAQSSAKVVAVGECGLDYYRFPPGVEAEEVKRGQAELFKQQMDLATECSLPLIIHCREAYDDLFVLLKEAVEAGKLPKRGVNHCFLGNRVQAKQFLELGFLLSFTGIITFKNAGVELLEVVKETPLTKIMVETDAPFLAPGQYRGGRNEPAYVVEVAKKIAELQGVAYEEVDTVTTQNGRSLFGIS